MDLRPPALPLLLTEMPRATIELGALAATWPLLLAAPAGDGHPVLVLPGLHATDAYSAVLRGALRARGHAAVGWGGGRNTGRWEALDEVVLPAIAGLHARTGRKVSLVGASMGGMYARAAARRVPGLVRCVVTLASAVHADPEATWLTPVYEAVTGERAERLWGGPAPVPCTSVFSRSDGLGDWRAVLLPRAPAHENVEVVGSHLGMAWNPAVLHLVADRLAQPEGQWQPFEPPPLLAPLYPAPRPADPREVPA